jgi:DNA invertase Pin-like site-specific DNA recombinase
MAFGYARVSTTEQDEALQRDALDAAGVDRLYVDHASGATDSRPGLDEMLGQPRPGDTVVIWRLDRLGRSLGNSCTWSPNLSSEEWDCAA